MKELDNSHLSSKGRCLANIYLMRRSEVAGVQGEDCRAKTEVQGEDAEEQSR